MSQCSCKKDRQACCIVHPTRDAPVEVWRAVLWHDYEPDPVDEVLFFDEGLARRQCRVWEETDEYSSLSMLTEVQYCTVHWEIDESGI